MIKNLKSKKEIRKQLKKDIAKFLSEGGKVTRVEPKGKRKKGELLNAFTVNGKAGRWYRGGVASANRLEWTANNTV